jgi:putative membrane protein
VTASIFAISFTLKEINMKNRLNFSKNALYSMTIIALGFGMASCNNSSKPEDTKEMAEESNEAKLEDRKSEKDAQFLVEAAEINLKEIQLGQLAQSKSKTADVIALGKMMEDEHTQAFNDLKTLADKKQITIPQSLTEKGMDAHKKLSEKSGHDFDKEYCDMMVKGHKDAIDKFEKAAKDCEDADIKSMAASMLPSLHTHLDHSQKCEEKVKDMK